MNPLQLGAQSEQQVEPQNFESVQKNSKQYLTFLMAEEEYGVDILAVQEIRGWEEITAIPNAPPCIKGVINLRGTIVPIMDLRQRFGLAPTESGPLTVVIVVKVALAAGTKIVGLVVDAVSDVYSIDEQEALAVPDITHDENALFVRGLVNVEDKMVVLLCLNQVLNIFTDTGSEDIGTESIGLQ